MLNLTDCSVGIENKKNVMNNVKWMEIQAPSIHFRMSFILFLSS